MKKSTILAALVAFYWAVSATQTTWAWSGGGHKVVALIAWSQLKPETQQKLVVIMRSHPRFNQEFKVPDFIQSQGDAVVNEWLFAQSAVWPDLIRNVQPFHHSSWHFVNLPYFLTDQDESALDNQLDVNLETDLPPHPAQANLNVMQCIALTQQKLSDANVSDSEKGIYLCWMVHTVGDIHQPLHTTALFSRVSFPQGDRGGNRIPVDTNHNLHSFWDRRLGNGADFARVRSDADALSMQFGSERAGAIATLDPEQWATEGRQFAEDVVYDAAILDAVKKHEMGITPSIDRVALSAAYKKAARELARKRVAVAGFRLAKMLEDTLDNVDVGTGAGTLRITALLPDPDGRDNSAEEIHLTNSGSADLDLDGWRVRDANGNELELHGTIEAGKSRKIVDTDNDIPLNNTGDEVRLINPQMQEVQKVSYRKRDVKRGVLIAF